MALHVFVAMPFNTKKSNDGKENIDFNQVYSQYIKSALEATEIKGERFEPFEVFRADEEMTAGNIHTNMFHELLLADLVIADLSIDNPNVWYELGVRHGLRARGVIQVLSRSDSKPFDVYTDRSLRYHLKNGVPDSELLEQDCLALARMAKETMASWHKHKISPVYHLLPYIKEPDWKDLLAGETEYGNKYEIWQGRIKTATRKGRPGDILVLASEVPLSALRVEVYRSAGKALVNLKQYKFALEQFNLALKYDPDDVVSQQQKGLILGRMGDHQEAKIWLERLASKEAGGSSETLGLLGRVDKMAWVKSWQQDGYDDTQKREIAIDEDALLRNAIKRYQQAILKNPTDYYPGINALALLYLLEYLTQDSSGSEQRSLMEAGIRWAIHCEIKLEKPGTQNYWAHVSLGDLEVLSGDTKTIERAYKDATAIAVSEKDWFALDSARQQLIIYQHLGFRPEQVNAALNIFEKAIHKIKAPFIPNKVFLFSGHMIDRFDRKIARFPAAMVDKVTIEIREKLHEMEAGPNDIALCGGACGGDIIFSEICLELGLQLHIHIPLPEPEFIKHSVSFAGEEWVIRYKKIKSHPNTKLFIATKELGIPPKKVNVYERNNYWQLYTALSWGAEKINCICLWDGGTGDGLGGTQHMYQEVEARAGYASIIKTTNILNEMQGTER